MSTNPRDLSSFVNYWGNRSNYQNVTIDSGIAVTGRVMPVRDIDDASATSSSAPTARVLRGEDVGFIIENARRVEDLALDAADRCAPSSFTKTPTASVLNGCVTSICKWFEPDNRNRFFVEGVYGNSGDEVVDLGTWYYYKIESGTPTIIGNNKSPKEYTRDKAITQDWLNSLDSTLLSDDMRRMFYTFKNTRFITDKSLKFYPFYDYSGNIVSRYEWPSGTNYGWAYESGEWKRETTTVPTYYFGAANYYIGDPEHNSTCTADGDLMISINDSSLTGKIKSVYFSVFFNLHFYNKPSEGTNTDSYVFYVPVQMKMSYVKTESSCEIWKFPSWCKDTRNIDALIIPKIPISFNGNRCAGGIGGNFVNSIVIELDLDSDLSGIGWNYTPS